MGDWWMFGCPHTYDHIGYLKDYFNQCDSDNRLQFYMFESRFLIWITDFWRLLSVDQSWDRSSSVSLCVWERRLSKAGRHHLRNVWSAISSSGFSRPLLLFQSKAGVGVSSDSAGTVSHVGRAVKAAVETSRLRFHIVSVSSHRLCGFM